MEELERNRYGFGPVITPELVAALLGCEVTTIETKLRAGTLPGLKVGRGWMIPWDAFIEHINREARANLVAPPGSLVQPVSYLTPPVPQKRRGRPRTN